MMDHNDIRHKLSEYIDNALPPNEKASVEAHLATCSECSDALRELRKTIEHIHSVEEVEAPAWMTAKVMAKVRAEQEARTSIWQRLFYPLAFKLPIQAAGVLFLAVTAFYIYKGAHPDYRYAEAPVAAPAIKENSPAAPAEQRQKAPAAPAPPAKLEQKPGYKALEMKDEYESPAPPAPAKQFEQPESPASARSAAPMKKELARSAKDEAALDKFAAAPEARSAAPSVMAEGAGASANLAAREKAKSAAACLNYEPTVVTVSGVIGRQDFPGPPNYESIANGDRKETYWVLKLDRPVCVAGKTGDDLNVSESSIAEMQLVLNSDAYAKYRRLLNKPVVVKGSLFHAHTGHHNTQVLLTVQDITEI